MEEVVIKALSDRVNDDAFLDKLADTVILDLEKKNTDHAEQDALEDQLKETDRKIRNIEKAVEDGLYTPNLKARLDDLIDQRAQLDEAIRLAKIKKPMLSREDILFVLRSLRGNPSDQDYRDKLVRLFLNSVYIFDDDTAVLAVNFQSNDGKPIEFKAALKAKNGSSLVSTGAPLCEEEW